MKTPPLPLRIILASCLLLAGGLISEAKLGLDREAYGVWDRTGGLSVETYPFTRGQEWTTAWEHINPARHVFDWSELDALLQFAYDQNQKLFAKVSPVGGQGGPPSWIYEDQGGDVPRVTGDVFDYGFYLDPEYKLYFSEMVQAMGDHMRNNVPAHLLDRVAFVRVDTGATGDEEPYENAGNIDFPELYGITNQEWEDFRLWAFEVYRQAFQEGPARKIPLLFQDIDPSQDPVEWAWVTGNVTAGFGAKFGGIVRGHHLTKSNTATTDFKDKAVDSDFGLFSRNEMDQTWQKTFFQLNIRLNMYWTAVEQLHPGLSVWDVTQSCLGNTYIDDYTFAFEFFNTWAAELDPPTARGGFSILHEGLDSSDTVKFPESIYGPANINNEQRYIDICAAYASRGALMNDSFAATKGQVYQRDAQTGFNDSSWLIVPGNYERFITQMDPDNTSKGLFRINGPLTTASHPYDRYARSFDSATGKNTMYFDIHDNLLPSRSQSVRLSVIYLDAGTGQFELQYDADSDSQKTAFVVTKTNSNTWKTETIIVDDWALQNNGPNGADLMLLNVDSEDDIFHMVELVKISEVTLGTVGKGSVSGRTDAIVYDPMVGTFDEGQRFELTVTPEPGWEFVGWSGDLDGTETRPFLYATEDARVTANFIYLGADLTEDNFNSADWTGGTGWSGNWIPSGEATPGAIVQLNNTGEITRNLGTPLSNATLSFMWDVDRITTGQPGEVYIKVGSIWLPDPVWSEGVKGDDSGSSPELAPATVNLSSFGTVSGIRFKLNGNSSTDRFWIDDVVILGSDGGGGTYEQPLFTSDPVEKGPGVEGSPYAGTLVGSALDANGDPMTFSKVPASGPAWLNVDSNGTLWGTPTAADIGLNRWTVEVTDGSGVPDEAYLLITVEPDGAPALSYAEWSSLFRLDQPQDGDDDGDAEPNIIEFSNGGSPVNRLDNGHQSTFELMSGSGSTWFEYAYAKRGSGLSYQMEVSSSLAPGSWSGTGYTETGNDPLNGYFNLITNRIEIPTDSPVFIRLRVEEN
ncbi:hypothetical protein G0Q06_00950 [Puniceicoccales bacterium CK1056]|uniref:Bacterial repeat domain-containing protein n=1 Tax=Oceanipulchritudo coccoides TaxID=2706888 RepID=A0A6B2LZR7_9BACT|nr:putative Ig domain-containing protein [Oceanipulchritudo coccoides]NDV61010.1 hypothetical protein [Oceanipulchritudo coccoides]